MNVEENEKDGYEILKLRIEIMRNPATYFLHLVAFMFEVSAQSQDF